MSKPTVKSLSEQVAALAAVVNTLVEAQTTAAPAAAPAEPQDTTSAVLESADFEAKFERQLPRAVSLAKRSGVSARLVGVPKKDGKGYSVWYMGCNRRMPKNGELLLEVSPTGEYSKRLAGLKVAS